MLRIPIDSFLGFVRVNYVEIVIVFAVTLIGTFLYFTSTNFLKRLKIEIFGYYPFDPFFPRSGEWSVGTFLLVILCLGLLIVFLFKGSFYPGPA